MLAIKKPGKIYASEVIAKQHSIACKDVVDLSEKMGIPWVMVTKDFYDKSMHCAMGIGVVFGVALTGLIYSGGKIIAIIKHNKNKN